MPKCRFCNRDNPAGIDRCQNCGSWLEQTVASASSERQSGEPAIQPDGSELRSPAADGIKPDSFEGQILGLMQGQKKIEAIKLYRQQTGAGLKEAKDAVEALAAQHGINPKGAGCAGAALLMVVVAAMIGIGVSCLSRMLG